ncbi:MAG: exodeoxyribonuclease VII large subunit, partial [Pseudomonadota bacterium]
ALRERATSLSKRTATTAAFAQRERVARLQSASRLLEGLSHQNVLARGFALVRGGDGALLRRAADVGDRKTGEIQFVDGARSVEFAAEDGGKKSPAAPKKSRPARQQGLFD